MLRDERVAAHDDVGPRRPALRREFDADDERAGHEAPAVALREQELEAQRLRRLARHDAGALLREAERDERLHGEGRSFRVAVEDDGMEAPARRQEVLARSDAAKELDEVRARGHVAGLRRVEQHHMREGDWPGLPMPFWGNHQQPTLH